MSCSICSLYLGVTRVHTLCPLRASITCRRCLHTGHLTKECVNSLTQWERPTSLEELIPAGLRHHYGITTRTPIQYPDRPGLLTPTDGNVILVTDDYEGLGEFIKKHNVEVTKITKDSTDARRRAIKAWASQHGYRVVMQKVVQKAVQVAAI